MSGFPCEACGQSHADLRDQLARVEKELAGLRLERDKQDRLIKVFAKQALVHQVRAKKMITTAADWMTTADIIQARCEALQEELDAVVLGRFKGSAPNPTKPERHAICGNCGWTGPESGLFDDGKFIFCPKCRNCDGNTLRPVEIPQPAPIDPEKDRQCQRLAQARGIIPASTMERALALMDDTLEGHE